MANPDGYTICLISSGHTVLAATNDKLSYDLEKDLHAVSQVTTLFYVLTVHPSFPAKNIKELIAYAKANPGKVNQGSSGTGALQHFAGEMLAYQAGVKFTHVPYKGGAASLAAVMAGEVQMSFTTLLSARPHMSSGKIRILGITAGKHLSLGVLSRGGANGNQCVGSVYTRTDAWADMILQAVTYGQARGGYTMPEWAANPQRGTTTTDGGTTPPVVVTKALGEACANDAECTTKNCLAPAADAPFVCTQSCDDANVCPDGFSCQGGFCFAGTAAPVDPGAVTTTTTTNGCSLSPSAPLESASFAPFAIVAGLGFIAARRRRG